MSARRLMGDGGRAALWSLLLLASPGARAIAGPADAGPPAEVTPPAARAPAAAVPAEPARFVLVRPGALLHTALPPAGAGQQAQLPPAPSDASAPGASTRFRLVRTAGAWVELETVASDAGSPHCHAPPAAFSALALRLYAATADLQPVTTRQVRLALGGSGALNLEPGVPVIPEGARWRAFPDGNAVSVDLPADAVGTAYTAGPAHPIAASAHVLARAAHISAAGLQLWPEARRGEAQCEWGAGRDGALAAYVQRSAPARDHRLAVEVQTSCALYAGTVEGAAVGAAQPPALSGMAGSPLNRHGRNRFSARAGATLRWSSGAAAGRATGEVPIPDGATLDRKHPCFDWPLARATVTATATAGAPTVTAAAASASALRLCFAPADLLESPAFLSDQQVSVPTAQTRRQVGIQIENRTARPDRELDAAVRTAARRRLFALGDVVLVPPGEETAHAAAHAQKLNLIRYLVHVHVEETLGGADSLTQRLVAAKLVRLDATPDGRTVKSSEMQQIQSPGEAQDTGAAGQAGALDDLVDSALEELAEALRGD